MTVVRGSDHPHVERGGSLPLLQRLVDRQAGSEALTVIVNTFDGDQQVPRHTHDVEEVLLLVSGRCSFLIGETWVVADAGDAVIVPPETTHGIAHQGPGRAIVLGVLATPDVELATFPGEAAPGTA